ncbi:MAG: hypothetical protein QOG53_3541 [Frankiales bacterium]|jgi:hypothetical protein|nr:hypothetical protein [Frankiales bacterium]
MRAMLTSRRLLVIGVITSFATLPMVPVVANANDAVATMPRVTLEVADHSLQGDGTMGAAATAAFHRGPLPASPHEVAQKAAANRASDAALSGAKSGSANTGSRPAGAAAGPAAPVTGHNFAGQADLFSTPSDSTGAIGLTRYIQLVNRRFAIYNRTTDALVDSGTLSEFLGVANSVDTFDPQIIWDPTSAKFIYLSDGVVSNTDNRLMYGFSKTDSPSSEADFCHYNGSFGSYFPDFPKLGDSDFFSILGANLYQGNTFAAASLMTVIKPAAGPITTCPTAASLDFHANFNLKDTANNRVFTPVPANGFDGTADGYVVARNLSLPSTKLWFFTVSRNSSTGAPIFGPARPLTVGSYTVPPAATQGGGSNRKIDTADTRITQAVVASNPARGNALSFWTQQTIASAGRSVVRWYEIDPVSATPGVLRSGTLSAPNTFFYNASIAPDRRVEGATVAFGDSFVIQYTASSSVNNINPAVVMVSSLHGGALSSGVVVKSSTGPYVDFACTSPTATCRWGDYSGATPDPKPGTPTAGAVWLTAQYGDGGSSTAVAHWLTQIWSAAP